jgi:hypothetical protein
MCTLIEFGARISADAIEPSALAILKSKIKAEISEESSSASPKKKKGAVDGVEGESSERDIYEDADDSYTNHEKNMTIDKALDRWSNHGDIIGDAVGLR